MHESPLAQMFVLEGQQIRGRQAILEALTVRFGEEQAQEFADVLERITDLDRLKELHKLAIKSRLSQFRKEMTRA
jgi:hypothetical protein